MGEGRGAPHPLVFIFLAHLLNINSAHQRSIADETQEKSYLLAELERSMIIGKLGLCTQPTLFFSFAPQKSKRLKLHKSHFSYFPVYDFIGISASLTRLSRSTPNLILNAFLHFYHSDFSHAIKQIPQCITLNA